MDEIGVIGGVINLDTHKTKRILIGGNDIDYMRFLHEELDKKIEIYDNKIKELEDKIKEIDERTKHHK